MTWMREGSRPTHRVTIPIVTGGQLHATYALLVASLLGCAGGSESGWPNDSQSPGEKASCKAMVDAVSTSCPGLITERLNAIEECEQDRIKYEPIGCGRDLAEWALCLTRGPVDCSDERLGCGARRDALDACESFFVGVTGCRRSEGTDGLMCVPGVTNYSIEVAGLPYSYRCVRDLPGNCRHNPDSVTLSCCSAFSG